MMRSFSWRVVGHSRLVALLVVTGFAVSLHSALAEFRVGLVLDRGGKDDKSFNSSAYEGATRAKTKLGIFLKYVEAADDNAFEPTLREFALRGFDLIIGIGFAQKEAIQKVAAQFPSKHFAIVDSQVNAANVRSLMFQEHEGAYVIGAIAAMTSKTGKIGFVGGMDIPLIRRFEMGYEAGAKKINPGIAIIRPGFVTHLKPANEGNIHPAHKPNLARLARHGGDGADDVCPFMLLKHQRPDICRVDLRVH